MEKRPDIKYFLILDADMGVINPRHKIEEYIDNNPEMDMIFYYRFGLLPFVGAYDIMADSFILK